MSLRRSVSSVLISVALVPLASRAEDPRRFLDVRGWTGSITIKGTGLDQSFGLEQRVDVSATGFLQYFGGPQYVQPPTDLYRWSGSLQSRVAVHNSSQRYQADFSIKTGTIECTGDSINDAWLDISITRNEYEVSYFPMFSSCQYTKRVGGVIVDQQTMSYQWAPNYFWPQSNRPTLPNFGLRLTGSTMVHFSSVSFGPYDPSIGGPEFFAGPADWEISWDLQPIGPPADLGPCKKRCEANVGAPINVTNGNVWLQGRDFSVPGLGGGLELVRTWNSLWQDQAYPELAGMFGDSWRSTYEERLAFPTAVAVQYWRSDGSAWTFAYTGSGGIYAMSSPTDEHASLQFDTVSNQYTLTLADGTKRLFNQLGYLVALLDRNSNRTDVTYDASNRITQVTSAGAQSIRFHYDDAAHARQATSVEDSTGVIASYTYGAQSVLSSVTYADNTSMTFLYGDPRNRTLITEVKDGAGVRLEAHTYDGGLRGLTSTRALGADQVTVTYQLGSSVQVTNSLNNTTAYTYYASGNRRFVTNVVGPGCSSCAVRGNYVMRYDSHGNQISVTDPNQHVTNYTYDANGNVLTKTVHLDSTDYVRTYTYNSFNEVLTDRDPLGNIFTYAYDANGNLRSITSPSPDGVQPPSVTTFDYDAGGKGLLVTTTDPLQNATNFDYWPTGLVKTVTDANQKATYFEYDGRGNRTLVRDALLNDIVFDYDLANHLTQITNADRSQIKFTYDSTRGRRDSVTDQNGNVTHFQYDDADRVRLVTDAANNPTTYGYDTENQLTGITDALLRSTSFGYDALGRITTVTFPSDPPGLYTETYAYDGVGNLRSKQDRNNQTITYSYDSLDRLQHKQYPDSTGIDFTYDALNRLTQISGTAANGTYGFAYDNLSRLTQVTTQYSFLLGNSYTVTYGYDAGSNRAQVTDPQNGIFNYQYDALNRIQTLTNMAQSEQYQFGYDDLSHRTSLTRPNGVTTSYGYDNVSNLLAVTHQVAGTTIDGASYTYLDSLGNPTGYPQSKTDLASGLTSTYSYDPIYRLNQVIQGTTAMETYTYDNVSNRLSSLGVAPYVYNNLWNRLDSIPASTWTYDNDGNTRTRVDANGTTTYNWDFENRLTSVVLPGSGGTVSFKYDPFGRRIQKVSTSGTINYVYDGDKVLEEVDSTGAVQAKYTQGERVDDALAMLRGGQSYFYEADVSGSVTSMTDSAGNIAATYAYDSFGRPTSATGSPSDPLRYTGREFDSETGLYYYRSRYYDPGIGRFLNEDPIGLRGGMNRYIYTANSPIKFNDPSGLDLHVGWLNYLFYSREKIEALQRVLDELNSPTGACLCALTRGGGYESLPWANRWIQVVFDPTLGPLFGGDGATNIQAGIIFLDPNVAPELWHGIIAHEGGHLRFPYVGHGDNDRRFEAPERACSHRYRRLYEKEYLESHDCGCP
jgi:RHS repeat-associated protein